MLFSLVYGMLALGTFLSGIRQVIFIVCFSFCCGERGLLRKQGNSITFRPSFLEHLTSRILAFIRLMLRSRYRSTTVLDSHPYRLVLIFKIGFPINE